MKTVLTIVIFSVFGILACNSITKKSGVSSEDSTTNLFTPPDTSTIPHDPYGEMVRYGRDLVFNTAKYIGPNGTAGVYLGNKMNCTNCHLDGGTRPFGLNFFSSHARYPEYRSREDRVLNMGERINNCIERPHNGIRMPLDSKELIAMECYIRWVGTNTPVGHHVKGDGALELNYPDRAADPEKGAVIYASNCASFHGKNGDGQWNADSSTYIYPPLWGATAYQKGSNPHKVLKAARFIKANMPHKIASWEKPFLTDEQAIDVSAFINDDRIHFRPEKKDKTIPDYPNPKSKSIDYGKGPYMDTFSEMQHKFGPYKPIIKYLKAYNLPVIF